MTYRRGIIVLGLATLMGWPTPSPGAPSAVDSSFRSFVDLPAAIPVDKTGLRVVADQMRRLQLALLALDAAQAGVRTKLDALGHAGRVADAELAVASSKVLQARTDAAQSLAVQATVAVQAAAPLQVAVRRAVFNAQRQLWIMAEQKLDDAGTALRDVRARNASMQQLQQQLDRRSAQVAERRDSVDDLPIAAVAADLASKQAATWRPPASWSTSPGTVHASADPAVLVEQIEPAAPPADELVWPATFQAPDADTEGLDDVQIASPSGLRSWSALIASMADAGATSEAGPLDGRGIAINVLPGEPIGSPEAGTVVFVGPFRTYGQILILNHHDGYHTLMAGFSHLDVDVGTKVRRGQIIGTLGDASGPFGRLYVEVRHHGVPVDPMPWIAAREDKVRG